MKPFRWVGGGTVDDVMREVAADPGAMFLAGGTTVVDLMKLDVLAPPALVQVGHLPFASIDVDDVGVHVGANVTNSALAWDPRIRERYPVLAEAILSGATTQLRNMATTAGNLLQRTRCPYFRDAHARCNRRVPGSGCDAIDGFDRSHAVLGTSPHCIATHPSDMCTALAILDATVRTRRPDGSVRSVAFADLHLLPEATPERETVLDPGELITHVDLPHPPPTLRSRYHKVRDRASYEFALASAAVALDMDGPVVREARIAVGGVATKPWRCRDGERLLVGQRPTAELLRAVADAAFFGAIPRKHNRFKIELGKRTVIRALGELLAGT